MANPDPPTWIDVAWQAFVNSGQRALSTKHVCSYGNSRRPTLDIVCDQQGATHRDFAYHPTSNRGTDTPGRPVYLRIRRAAPQNLPIICLSYAYQVAITNLSGVAMPIRCPRASGHSERDSRNRLKSKRAGRQHEFVGSPVATREGPLPAIYIPPCTGNRHPLMADLPITQYQIGAP